MIYHAFRFATRKEAKRRNVPQGWYFSPHFHVVGRILGGYSKCRKCKNWMNRDCKRGCGGFNDRAYWECYKKTEYYVKVLLTNLCKILEINVWYGNPSATASL